MDDEGQATALRQAKMPIEIVALDVQGRVVPIPIETGFADGNNFRFAGQLFDDFPVARFRFGCVIRLNADRCVNAGILLSDFDGLLAAVRRRSDRDDARDPGLLCALDNLSPIVGQEGLLYRSWRFICC